jgi:predicted SAM-dependent methyltransferase
MNAIKKVNCSVCKSTKSAYYITTNALMHATNNQQFVFNKCGSCDCVFLINPIPALKLKDYYTDNYLPYRGAEAWGIYKSFVIKNQEKLDFKRVQIVAKNIKGTTPFSILDVGCGNPSFLMAVQKKLHANGTGIDFSDHGWKNHNVENIELIKSSIADYNPSNTFDVITLWHYLEHDYNLQETVDKLYQLLNPSGKLIIEVPDYKSITARKQKQFWQGWHSPRHLTLFSKKGFQKLFTSDKWVVVKYNKFGTLDAFTLWWLGHMEQKKINWSGNMAGNFWRLVFLKTVSWPFFIFEKVIPMGIQLIILEKK